MVDHYPLFKFGGIILIIKQHQVTKKKPIVSTKKQSRIFMPLCCVTIVSGTGEAFIFPTGNEVKMGRNP